MLLPKGKDGVPTVLYQITIGSEENESGWVVQADPKTGKLWTATSYSLDTGGLPPEYEPERISVILVSEIPTRAAHLTMSPGTLAPLLAPIHRNLMSLAR
jgi:hypothetical protein